MAVFPKQICKRFLPDAGESRSDKTFFLKTNMELEACTSLGSMFHRRGALFVNEIRPRLVHRHMLPGTLPESCATHDRSGFKSRLVGAGFRRGLQDDVALPALATGPFLAIF